MKFLILFFIFNITQFSILKNQQRQLGSSEEQPEDTYELKAKETHSQSNVNPFMNPMFPYIMQQTQQPYLSNVEVNKSTVPPYGKSTTINHVPNPFYGTYPMMPFYDPTYYGLSPFNSFTHFDPFKMPQNPLMSMYQEEADNQQEMQQQRDQESQELSKYGTQVNVNDLKNLTFYDQKNLNLGTNFMNSLDEKLNQEEAINQDEQNVQLAKLSGQSDQDIYDSKKLFNDIYLDSLQNQNQDSENDNNKVEIEDVENQDEDDQEQNFDQEQIKQFYKYMQIQQEQSQHETFETEDDSQLTQGQKKKIIALLFGKLLKMHQKVMFIGGALHILIIMCILFHMFNLGTIESENKWCYLTWPLMHLYYAFVNYIFIWFFCFNAYEVKKKNAINVVKISLKFLRVFILLSFVVFPLKYLSQKYCSAWTLSWHSVYLEFGHIFLVTLIFYVYFNWFEKKYIGFRIYYKSSNFN